MQRTSWIPCWRRPRLYSAVARVGVATFFSFSRVCAVRFAIGLVLSCRLDPLPSPRKRGSPGMTLHGAVRLHVERVERMAARHVEPVVLRTAEAQVRAPLGQTDEADRLALRVEDLDPVEVFRLALQPEHLPAVDVRRLRLE